MGLIFAASPRQIDLRTAALIVRELPPFITPVGVFVDASLDEIRAAREAIPNMAIQLHGDEPPHIVQSLESAAIKTLPVATDLHDSSVIEAQATEYPRVPLLFDTSAAGKRGGTGVAFDWHLIEPLARTRRVIVSGGLTPENVGACVRAVRPYAVDVRSGVESEGRKDESKMRAFVQAVREADAA